jgi:hypothetical protein
MATINRILLFTGILAIGLGATVPHLPQAFASGKSTDFGSEGSNGYFTCVNPNQTGPGCPNDQSTSTTSHNSQQQHTIAYERGFQMGQEDARNGAQSNSGDQCFDFYSSAKEVDHCGVAYNDGYNSVGH